MSGGFNNPIVGGEDNLIREAIQSPNYVPGVSGWTINKDGSAEFNDGIFRGGIIVSGAGGEILVYSPTPGLGNLIFALASAGDTDPYGNTYRAGITLQRTTTLEDPGALTWLLNQSENKPALVTAIEIGGQTILLLQGAAPTALASPAAISLIDDGTVSVSAPVTSSTGDHLSLGAGAAGIILNPDTGRVIYLGSSNKATGFAAEQHGTFNAVFTASNSASGTLTFPNTFPNVPVLVATVQVGGNNDIDINWTTSPTTGSVTWRAFQKSGTNITVTAIIHWWGVG